jgi:hypothetical protein
MTRYHYDGYGEESTKHVIDGDTNLDSLRNRFNAYYAQPRIIDFNRGFKHQFAQNSVRSEMQRGSGGGCDYTLYFQIEKLEPLKVTM